MRSILLNCSILNWRKKLIIHVDHSTTQGWDFTSLTLGLKLIPMTLAYFWPKVHQVDPTWRLYDQQTTLTSMSEKKREKRIGMIYPRVNDHFIDSYEISKDSIGSLLPKFHQTLNCLHFHNNFLFYFLLPNSPFRKLSLLPLPTSPYLHILLVAE